MSIAKGLFANRVRIIFTDLELRKKINETRIIFHETWTLTANDPSDRDLFDDDTAKNQILTSQIKFCIQFQRTW